MNFFKAFKPFFYGIFTVILACSTVTFPYSTHLTKHIKSQEFEWAVIGAGPAGILTVGLLLDNHVPASSIAWIDSEFKVGALGKYYQGVPGNLSTKQWISIIEGCNHLKECPTNPLNYLKMHDLDSFYPLSIIVNPLQDITNWFLTKVYSFKDKVLNYQNNGYYWVILTDKTRFIKAHKVILATGSHPRSLKYPCIHEIPFEVALNKEKLSQEICPNDTIAVVGSAHSAVIALKFLSELPVKRIIHFYKSPFKYIVSTPQGPINAETGLKGPAAQFAREVLEKNLPANMIRVFNDEAAQNIWLPQCTKIIYAVGFEQNMMPFDTRKSISYDDTTGVIAHNLFGIGIAFPEKKADALGNIEHRVGMPFFLDYGKRVIPQWIAMA